MRTRTAANRSRSVPCPLTRNAAPPSHVFRNSRAPSRIRLDAGFPSLVRGTRHRSGRCARRVQHPSGPRTRWTGTRLSCGSASPQSAAQPRERGAHPALRAMPRSRRHGASAAAPRGHRGWSLAPDRLRTRRTGIRPSSGSAAPAARPKAAARGRAPARRANPDLEPRRRPGGAPAGGRAEWGPAAWRRDRDSNPRWDLNPTPH